MAGGAASAVAQLKEWQYERGQDGINGSKKEGKCVILRVARRDDREIRRLGRPGAEASDLG